MPFARPTLTALRTQAMQDITASDLPDADGFLRRSALRVLAWVQAGMAYLHYGYLDWIARQAVPFTAEGEYLEAWAALAPVPVLRAAPTAASGPASWPGTAGTVLPAGTVCARSDGVQFATVADAAVSGGGTVAATVVALLPGALGNTDSGAPLTLGAAVPGINPAGAAAAALTGGSDLETDASLRARMLESYAAPPHGGNQADYVTWALSVPGVTRAWCAPQGMGAGTVAVYFMMDAAETAFGGFPQGTNGVAAAETRGTAATGDQLAVANAIYPLRPVTALVYALAPAAQPLAFTLAGLASIGLAQQRAVSAALASLLVAKDTPLATVSVEQSDVAAAVIAVGGLPSFAVTVPSSWPATSAPGSLFTLGTVSFV